MQLTRDTGAVHYIRAWEPGRVRIAEVRRGDLVREIVEHHGGRANGSGERAAIPRDELMGLRGSIVFVSERDGNAEIYLANLTRRFPNVRVVAIADMILDRHGSNLLSV